MRKLLAIWALAACCVEGRDAVEGIHGLHCAFTEDHVDWPRLLGALYELSTNGSHTAVMISSAQLQLHMDSDKERDLSSDGCFIGLFTLRLVVVFITLLQDGIFLEGIHDPELQRGFEHLQSFSMVQVLQSPFAFSLFEALNAYSRKAREMCPLLNQPPVPMAVSNELRSPFWATLRCLRSSGTLMALQIGAAFTTAWCGVQEPNGPAAPEGTVVHKISNEEARQLLVPLWERLQVDLQRRDAKPSTDLVLAAMLYFEQNRISCAEVEMAAVLVMAWGKLIPLSQAMMVVDSTIKDLRFAHSVFTRWPIWELLGRLSLPRPGSSSTWNLRPDSCLHFEACPRTVTFYRRNQVVTAQELADLRCPAPAARLRFSYRSGVLRLRSDLKEVMQPAGVQDLFWLPELQLFDLSKSLERIPFQASLVESGHDVRQRLVTVKDLPLHLGWEGVQIFSLHHSRRHGDTFLEPQRLSKLGEVQPRRPDSGVSVHFLVLESASRAAFEAYCPLTMAFLKQQRYNPKVRTWRVSDLTMLHSLSSGTAANMLAALSGFSYDPQKESQRRASWNCEVVLDGVPEERLLWNIAHAHGYTTLFGATGCNGILGTRYCKRQLSKFDRVVPTLEIDPNCHSQKEWSLIFADRNGTRGCVGEKRPHQHVLDYVLRFQEIHSDVPIFSYVHLETTHDSQEALRLLDQALVHHLEALARLPPEAQPVIVLAGDHGPSSTCDESFPLASILMPEVRFPDAGCGGAENCGLPRIDPGTLKHQEARNWRRYWWNLEQNRFIISSWFDMYSTFVHLITGKDPRGGAQNHFEAKDAPDHWAQSLLVRGSKERTCTEAGLPLWHCACARRWVGWCPIAVRGQAEVAKRALQEAQNAFDVEAAKFRADTRKCRPQRLEQVLGCQSQLDSLGSLEQELKSVGGSAEGLLRMRFLTDQGMEFQFYASVFFRSESGEIKDLVGSLREIFQLLPRSPYGPNEKCTPPNMDPAFCACADEAELRRARLDDP